MSGTNSAFHCTPCGANFDSQMELERHNSTSHQGQAGREGSNREAGREGSNREAGREGSNRER